MDYSNRQKIEPYLYKVVLLVAVIVFETGEFVIHTVTIVKQYRRSKVYLNLEFSQLCSGARKKITFLRAQLDCVLWIPNYSRFSTMSNSFEPRHNRKLIFASSIYKFLELIGGVMSNLNLTSFKRMFSCSVLCLFLVLCWNGSIQIW